jgi:hypothetical protein
MKSVKNKYGERLISDERIAEVIKKHNLGNK